MIHSYSNYFRKFCVRYIIYAAVDNSRNIYVSTYDIRQSVVSRMRKPKFIVQVARWGLRKALKNFHKVSPSQFFSTGHHS